MTLDRGHTQEDHTADMILHGRGPLFADALEEVAVCMFELMSPNNTKTVRQTTSVPLEIVADNREMLMFHFLNELLCGVWGERKILVGKVKVKSCSKVTEQEEEEENNDDEEKKGEQVEMKKEGGNENDGDDDDATKKKAHQPSKHKKSVSRWLLRAVAHGEVWDPSRHLPGTDVKAMTMHSLKCEECEEDMLFHCSCVVDI